MINFNCFYCKHSTSLIFAFLVVIFNRISRKQNSPSVFVLPFPIYLWKVILFNSGDKLLLLLAYLTLLDKLLLAFSLFTLLIYVVRVM